MAFHIGEILIGPLLHRVPALTEHVSGVMWRKEKLKVERMAKAIRNSRQTLTSSVWSVLRCVYR